MLGLGGCADLLSEEPPETTESVEPIQISPRVLELADKAVSEGRFKDAEDLLARIFLVDPTNIDGRLIAAELYLAKGDSARAMRNFSALTEIPEVSARANQGAGIAMILNGASEPGVTHLERAIEADPTLWRAWNALGSYYDSHGRWEDAAKAYQMALAEQPDEPMIYNNRGFSLFIQGRMDEAIIDLQRALRLDPDMGPAKANLRLALAWNGRYVHAMTGVAENDMARVLNNIGYIALLRGDLDNAEAYLQRAMELDPRYNEIASRNLNYLRNLREIESTAAQGETATAAEAAVADGE
jgi:Flp pilus assembly protein TadD